VTASTLMVLLLAMEVTCCSRSFKLCCHFPQYSALLYLDPD
jgi:hypothetical protein